MQHPVTAGPTRGWPDRLPLWRSLLLPIAAFLCLMQAAGGGVAATAVPEYTIGVLAFRGKDQAIKNWQPTVDYLTRSLPGRQFRLLPLLLDQIPEAINQRRIDFMLTNPENYIVLEARHQVTRNATLLRSEGGQVLKEFGGLIFTRADRTDLKTLHDLKGRRLAGVAHNGFGAYQMQAFELMGAGIQPDDFTALFVGAPQDKVVEVVAQGKADAGFVRAGVLESMAAAGKIRFEDFRGIGLKQNSRFPFLLSTALYPEWAFATLPHVDEQLANRVTVALLSMPFGGDVAKAGGYHGWVVPLSYNSVHDMMKALRAAPYDTPVDFSPLDIARKYERPIMLLLLGILAVLGFVMRRFARLNRALNEQMTLVTERGSRLIAEVETRQQTEWQLANENRVLELLAKDTPLPGILLTIAQMAAARFADAGIAILVASDGRYSIGAIQGIDEARRKKLAEILPTIDPKSGEAAALSDLLIGDGRNCRNETIRNGARKPVGLFLLATPDGKTGKDELPTLAALAGMAMERTAIGERMRLSTSFFQNALEGIVITDPLGRIVDVNPSFTHLTGYERADVIGQTMGILRSGRHDAEFYRAMWAQLLEAGRWSGEIWNRRRDGRIIAERLQISSVKDKQGEITHFVGTFTDITSLMDAQAHLEKLASFDSLTGLPNRGLLADRLNQSLSQAQRRDRLLAICFLDLDGFKAVNDTHGHAAGDALLREVAQRLSSTVRSGDTVARMGGDEFVLLLSDIKDVDELESALHRVLLAVGTPYDLSGRPAQVSTSIGVTLYPFDDGDPDTLLRHADQAMYRAKQDGRNRYHMFDNEYASAHQERMLLRDRLRLAVEQEELVLHYQPRVDLRRRHVAGVEALLRWQHPEKGLLAPGTFLPDVESDDLICVIGGWVLREALTQQRRWRADGITLTVSVNIAARQFVDPRFISNLAALLAEFPDHVEGGLELEILESAAIEDTSRVAEVIQECHELGLRFALDDFGTGYSSLTYLQRLPADTLKIDRSFVNGMLGSSSGLAIVEAIVGLANAFQCELIAEGIECVEQGELLARMGCGSGQGYFIARPMPAADIPSWTAAYRHPPTWSFWAEAGYGTQDFPLVLAEFEHRCWIRDLIGATEGQPLATSAEAIDDPTRCEFGRWMEQRGRGRYGQSPLFAEVDARHHEVHGVGRRIRDALGAGASTEARGHVPALRQASERLVSALGRLQRGLANPDTTE
ncbi:MAG: EAL domain-containing protein [Gammaproteobacteria bacterium]|nr:EAL domain-containing protein [Gammaproteobacteria bacterium]MBU1646530.1 EAL domain-containing protein [Gammaproteobacteria bacterium]MBU1973717.1 EAL domain-containing protein [Gammaproteobacteria bacterium]